jgi:hypothetical protein
MILFGLNAFQLVMSTAMLAGLLALLAGVGRGTVRRREGALWGLVLAAGLLAVLWPNSTSRVARLLGVGRGADLVLYLAVVAMLVGFWMIYIRLRQLRRDVTLLVRHLALEAAERELTPGGAAPPPPDAPAPAARGPRGESS